MGRASIAANLATSGFKKEHSMWRASIAAGLVTSVFLKALDGKSIHRCQPALMPGFLESFHGAGIHRCQPGNVGVPKHSMGPASIAANLVTSGFLRAFDEASIHRCRRGIVGFPRAFDGAKRNMPHCSLKRKKTASSELSPLIATHVFLSAWRYNLDIQSADAFARDLAGIL